MRPDSQGEELRALIVSASFGRGHDQANSAVDGAFRSRGVNLNARHADILEYLSPLERLVTAGTYEFWLKYTPGMYRWFYNVTDGHALPTAQTFGWLGLQAMTRDVRSLRPQVVLSSYPTSVALAHHVRRRERVDFLNALVVTDYRVHQHWARPEAELLLVPNEETAGQLSRWRIPPERVEVTGIPISPIFRELLGADKSSLRLEHGLKPDLPLVLLSGGGAGHYRRVREVVSELGNLGRRVQVLVPAGAQERGVSQVGGATVHHLGFTPDFPALLAASDLVVGKAGGLTVAEATALGVPMVVFDPIPGQEEHNAAFLARHGAGLYVRDQRELRRAILRALDADEHAGLSAAARAVGRVDAAERVASAILKKLESSL
ncbi:MGDG synthase family glycosyltransferase [Deinococcus cavernae]|uniref:MGDG synthase family glycosyltransferase n=1 Tax=Deinococcus cavernae TaxID=2320857 RepID=UPI001F3FBB78|nr:glycosyltransferase [Deinococcus cavernae]